MVRLAFALFTALSLAACNPSPGQLEVTEVWARDTVGGTANAAVFMTIASPSADRLVAASSTVATRTDLMTMEAGGDTMAMAYVEAIDIPAGEPVSLNPTGLHVWLDDLDAPLKAGQAIPLALEFEKAGRREVSVEVIAPAAAAPGT